MSIVRTALCTACFFATLIGTCWGIRRGEPFPKVLGITQKWLYYQQHKDETDLIFVGSSRVYHAVIPPQFDEKVRAATGRTLRSSNLAFDALWPPESLYFLRQLLATKSPRLKWVVLECIRFYPDDRAQMGGTRRMEYWHDWRHTVLAWQSIRDAGFPPLKMWTLASQHGEVFARTFTHQGRGAEELAVRFGVEKRKRDDRWAPPTEWNERGGYEPEDEKKLSGPPLDRYRAMLAARRTEFPTAPPSPALRRAYTEIVREIRAAGCEPILLVTPTLLVEENIGAHFPEFTVWNFNDPNQHPDLFDPIYRHDVTHLSHEGAQRFTDLLAARFAEHLRAEKR